MTTEGSTKPLATVVATATPKIKTPAKLPIAANKTAFLKLRTFVATTVAMAFAASFMPLPKSKIKAMIMVKATMKKNLENVRLLLKTAIPKMTDYDCSCKHALEGAFI